MMLTIHEEQLRESAARWDALMRSGRIRIIGSTTDGNHIGVEFWRDYPIELEASDTARLRLMEYADSLR
jgi:hypothetical protein